VWMFTDAAQMLLLVDLMWSTFGSKKHTYVNYTSQQMSENLYNDFPTLINTWYCPWRWRNWNNSAHLNSLSLISAHYTLGVSVHEFTRGMKFISSQLTRKISDQLVVGSLSSQTQGQPAFCIYQEWLLEGATSEKMYFTFKIIRWQRKRVNRSLPPEYYTDWKECLMHQISLFSRLALVWRCLITN